ncbi:MAG: 1,4-dihydroxy-2-naphthoate polyprenyltransferase [Deltaproteobacteria bacterium]|nr:1,4-dihydroxy-2-naphthoate polyprenyltransferase [Deltaproteobacteria bacterium]
MNPTSPPRPGKIAAWLWATRPRTLSAALGPVLVGNALAYAEGGSISYALTLATLFCATALQIGANLANDYFDFKKGADTSERLGPPRATQQGWLAPKTVLVGALVVLMMAAITGSYLVWVGGWPFVVLGLLSIAAAVGYTGGPRPLGYHGLGDVAVFFFFGLVAVCGSYYLQRSTVSPLSLWAALGVGALVTAILVVNNIRDRESDRRAGKRTLAVRLGLKVSQLQYALLLLLALLVPPLAMLSSGASATWLLALGSAPLALYELRALRRREGVQLNRSLAGTARLSLIYSLLLALGVLL